MTERLTTVAPDLVGQLASLPNDDQRRIAVALAQEAARRTRLEKCPDDESIEEMASRLDEVAWMTQERFEGGQATEREYLLSFERARAAWAAHFAAEPDTRTAVLESAYEVQAALGSVEQLRSVLRSLLS